MWYIFVYWIHEDFSCPFIQFGTDSKKFKTFCSHQKIAFRYYTVIGLVLRGLEIYLFLFLHKGPIYHSRRYELAWLFSLHNQRLFWLKFTFRINLYRKTKFFLGIFDWAFEMLLAELKNLLIWSLFHSFMAVNFPFSFH